MSIKVKVSIKNQDKVQPRIFRLDDEQSTLEELRGKVKENPWQALGSNFYFLDDDAEITQNDEAKYKLSEFKNQEKYIVEVFIPTQSEGKKVTAEKEREEAEAARKEVEEIKIASQIDPERKPNIPKPDNFDENLINHDGSRETGEEGIYYKQKWDKLKPLLESFKFPKALKVTSQGLEPVNRPGVKLSQAISENDVENEVQISDQSEAYYTEWEKQAYKMLSKSVKASVGIPIPQLSATLGLSGSYGTSSESLSQSRETYLFLVAQRLVQKTKVILNEETIQLTEDFKKSVESAKDIHELRQVFQKYGYFVPTTYIIGGKIIAEKTETCSAQSDETALSNKFAVGVSAKFDKAGFTASASAGYSQEKQNIDSQSSADIASRAMITLKGGDEGFINDGAKWISSLTLDRWQIVGYADLKPITEFLDEKLKQKCKDLISTGTPWLEVQYVGSASLVKEEDDKRSGANRDLTVYKPSVDSEWFWVGQYAQGDYNTPNGQTIIIKPLHPDAVKPPIKFEQIWTDKGPTMNSKYYSCWKPIPPNGYVALGHIMRLKADNYEPPSEDEIKGLVCVHKDLVSRADIGEFSIWDDKGTWASQDCTLWLYQA